jgi:hypothetical protein
MRKKSFLYVKNYSKYYVNIINLEKGIYLFMLKMK